MSISTRQAGSYDPEFGILGKAELPVFFEGALDRLITDIALQNENVLASAVAGDTTQKSHFAITRFTSNGLLDTSFAENGIRSGLFKPDELSSSEALAVMPGGGIVLLGSSARSRWDLFKPVLSYFDKDGNGPSSITWLDIPENTGLVIANSLLRVDAQYLLASVNLLTAQNTQKSARIYRLGLDGTRGFGQSDFIEILPGQQNILVTGLVQLPDTFIVSGTQTSEQGEPQGFIARYHNNGSLDLSFGTSGVVNLRAAEQPTVINCLLRRPGGQLIVAGSVQSSQSPTNLALLWQFTQDGVADLQFNKGMPVLAELHPQASSAWHTMALQADGKLVVFGEADILRYLRYMPDGAVDPDYQPFEELTGLTDNFTCLARADNTLLGVNVTGLGGHIGVAMSIFS